MDHCLAFLEKLENEPHMYKVKHDIDKHDIDLVTSTFIMYALQPNQSNNRKNDMFLIMSGTFSSDEQWLDIIWGMNQRHLC